MLKSFLFGIGKLILLFIGIVVFFSISYEIISYLSGFFAFSSEEGYSAFSIFVGTLVGYYLGSNRSPYSGKKIAKYDKEIQKKEMETRALYFNRGNTYKSKGDYDNAIADYEAVLHIDPDDETAKKNLEEAKNLKEQSVANNSATAE